LSTKKNFRIKKKHLGENHTAARPRVFSPSPPWGPLYVTQTFFLISTIWRPKMAVAMVWELYNSGAPKSVFLKSNRTSAISFRNI